MATKREHQHAEYIGELKSDLAKSEEWQRAIPNNLLSRRLLEHFTEAQIELFLSICDSVCPYCHNAENGCPCWNDE